MQMGDSSGWGDQSDQGVLDDTGIRGGQGGRGIKIIISIQKLYGSHGLNHQIIEKS